MLRVQLCRLRPVYGTEMLGARHYTISNPWWQWLREYGPFHYGQMRYGVT